VSNLTRIIRNLYIRLEALLSSLFGGFFGFLSRLFRFNNPDYFLATDDAQSVGIKQASVEQSIKPSVNTSAETPIAKRRRANSKTDDYFMNMARDVKKK
jgi:hypothetical protein